MSDQVKDEEPEITSTDLSRLETGDPFIALLANVAEKFDTKIGVTFTVGGFLVSGFLVSSHEYGQALGDELGWKEALETLFPAWTDEEKHQANIFAEREFVHLKDAKFFSASGTVIPNNRGVWWRARVNQISGVNIGTLSASSD